MAKEITIKGKEWLIEEYHERYDKLYETIIEVLKKNEDIMQWELNIEPCELTINGCEQTYMRLRMRAKQDLASIITATGPSWSTSISPATVTPWIQDVNNLTTPLSTVTVARSGEDEAIPNKLVKYDRNHVISTENPYQE